MEFKKERTIEAMDRKKTHIAALREKEEIFKEKKHLERGLCKYENLVGSDVVLEAGLGLEASLEASL